MRKQSAFTSIAAFLIVMFSASSLVHSFSRNARSFARPTTMAHFSSSSGSGEGITMVDRCRQKISDALETSNVKVTGAYDDPNGSHISIQVVSDMFKGKRPVQRQQMVYKALWEELKEGGPVHAVDSMVCKTPDEA